MKRPAHLILAFLALTLAALAVWQFRPAPQSTPQVSPSPSPTPEAAQALVTLYFANRSYVETGDESLPHLLAEQRTVNLKGTNRAAATIRALQAGPKSSKAARVIRENLRILGVRVKGDLAQVDMAREGLSGGSLEELLLIQGVVKTLTELPDIRSVLFLVDGQRTDTLMGHLSVYEPLTASDAD